MGEDEYIRVDLVAELGREGEEVCALGFNFADLAEGRALELSDFVRQIRRQRDDSCGLRSLISLR